MAKRPQHWWRVTLYEHDEGRIKDSHHPFRRIEFRIPASKKHHPDRDDIDAKLAKVGYRVNRKLDRRAKLKDFGGDYDWMVGASSYLQRPGRERLDRVGDMERPFAAGPGPDEPVESVRGIKVIDWPNGRPKENPGSGMSLFHTTFAQNLPAIARKGLVPGRPAALGGGHIEAHLRGAIFLTSAEGLDFWYTAAQESDAFVGSDDPLAEGYTPVVLRVPRRPHECDIDEYGTDDADALAYRCPTKISPGQLQVWSGEIWLPIGDYKQIDPSIAYDEDGSFSTEYWLLPEWRDREENPKRRKPKAKRRKTKTKRVTGVRSLVSKALR